MSLGSRIVTGGRAALSASLASTPRDPLLFLYPSWIRKSSSAPFLRQQNHLQEAHSKAEHFRSTIVPGPRGSLKTPLRPPNSHIAAKPNETSPPERGQGCDLQKYGNPRIAFETIEFPETHSGKIQSKYPNAERTVRKILSTQKQIESTEESDRQVRRAYHEYRRKQLGTLGADWRAVLGDLTKESDTHGEWLEKALQIEVPVGSAGPLLHGVDDFIPNIGSKYDCTVELGPREVREGLRSEQQSFILSGSAKAISKTAADVLRVAPNATIMTTHGLPLHSRAVGPPRTLKTVEEALLKTRNVFSYRRAGGSGPSRIAEEVPVEAIRKPAIWTVESFLSYVEALTASKMPNHLRRFGFRLDDDHDSSVTEILRSLFKDPSLNHAISREAFHVAMIYFMKCNRIEDVRVLFVRMEIMGMQSVPETFNIMMRGAAKRGDVHNFHFILHLMLRRGLKPNSGTWVAFMMAQSDFRIKLYILNAMKKKGMLFHTSTLKDVCAQLVELEVESSLGLNQTQEEFVSHMDSRYGQYWLSLDSGTRILHALGSHGLISRCWEFLSLMHSRFIKHDVYSFNTILHHCKQYNNLTGAIDLIRHTPGHLAFSADMDTYRILFELAWRTRSYNMARVVWRYSCLAAATTYRMRQRVSHSLKTFATTKTNSPRTPRELWERLAGPFIIGLGGVPTESEKRMETKFVDRVQSELRSLQVPSDPAVEIIPGKDVASSLQAVTPGSATLCTIDSDAKSGRERISAQTQNLLEVDYEMFMSYRPATPFLEMLILAHERDVEWRRDGRYKAATLRWLMAHAVCVPLVPKAGAKLHISWE